jgi:hypothetical protein
MTLNPSLVDLTPPAGKSNSLWLTRFQALSQGDQGEEAYRIFYVGAESVGGGTPTYFAGSGNSDQGSAPGDVHRRGERWARFVGHVQHQPGRRHEQQRTSEQGQG